MNTRTWALAAPLAIVLLAGPSPTQNQNPVPVRIAVQHYGGEDTTSPNLWLDCQFTNRTEIRLMGGVAGEAACIFVDTQSARQKTAAGTMLVTPNAVTHVGIFDQNGVFAIPFELAAPGAALFAQGLCLSTASGGAIDLSHGLEIASVAGNAQPTLQYAGPPITAIPCRFGSPVTSSTWRVPSNPKLARHELVLQFAVPSPGFLMQLSNVIETDYVTKVFVTLIGSSARIAPRLRDVRAPVYRLRSVFDLGRHVAARLEVWVDASSASVPRASSFRLAAVIDTKY